ncbi:hypothetical protein [Pseudarthrobacter sp. PS3-L1]|uniref:hypothetical protein n=1 Tax=Pseudarthrobacter sp. PS3-L1 TaxID=3046207 RepID=UPI0024BB2B7B|nr:hypothetical protein [Pseudarthrobacter sp. PS3-L1]MDJ0320881.1 hypothetical protein [Pseudarthrobacter sp. PS3-L1]
MRKMSREHPWLFLAISLVTVWLLLFAFGAATGRTPGEAATNAVPYAVIVALVGAFQLRKVRKVHAHLAIENQVLGYVRYPDSKSGSLSGIWNLVIITPGAGESRFQSADSHTFEATGRETRVPLLGLSPARRTLPLVEKYIAISGLSAAMAQTASGRLEIAATPEDLDRLAAAISPANTSPGDRSTP